MIELTNDASAPHPVTAGMAAGLVDFDQIISQKTVATNLADANFANWIGSIYPC